MATDNKRPETIADLLAIVDQMEHNVIATGAGSLPTNPDESISIYFKTAIDATMSKITDRMMTLDSDLVTAKSPRLAKLNQNLKTGKEKARFKVKATPKPTIEELHEQATTITIGTTTIRPMDEGVAR